MQLYSGTRVTLKKRKLDTFLTPTFIVPIVQYAEPLRADGLAFISAAV